MVLQFTRIHFVATMPCSYCNAQFTITRWKSLCGKCSKKFCSDCINSGQCKSCGSVIRTRFDRSKLMQLKIKDLRLYLINRNQPTDDCKEKYELVKLIQTLHGIYEPDLASHTQAYDTSYNTHLGEDPTTTHQSDAGFSQRLGDGINNIPNFHPPSYQQTQHSFPTAHEFSHATSSQPEANRFASSESETKNASASSENKSPHKEFPDIIDINSTEELHSLSVKQLKFILRNNFVNFQGVLEKKDLIAKVEILFLQQKKDNDSVKADAAQSGDKEVPKEAKDENFCKICWDNPANCVFLECGHMMTCIDCSKQIVECPVCRQNIVRKVRVFKS